MNKSDNDNASRAATSNAFAVAAILVPVAMIALVIIFGKYLSIFDVQKCDAKISESLKAPSTYERVSFERMYGNEYLIEYDAANLFGVPLRGKGYCTVNGDSVDWIELP
jgi:hypothetical protein